MRKSPRLASLTFLALVFATFLSSKANAQCSIVSTNGYVVNVSIVPKTIVVSTTNCQWGYNYNVGFDYNITITGPGAAAQYTLQALIYCVNNQINGAYSLPKGGGSGSAVTTTNPAIPHNGTAYGYNAPYVPCTSASVSNFQCNAIDLIIEGPGIPYQQIHCNSIVSPLPVAFLYFDGEKKTGGNLLTWAVETEQRNAYFTIETSTDGENWKELTKVTGAGTSEEAKTYSFFDSKNMQIPTYYKLSQTDFDGTRNELALKYIPADNFEFKLYPNPSADGKVHIEFSGNSQNGSMLLLRNELGQLVLQQDLAPVAESGKTAFYSSELDLAQPAGIYFVEISSGDQLVNRSKLVIR